MPCKTDADFLIVMKTGKYFWAIKEFLCNYSLTLPKPELSISYKDVDASASLP
jgi:hypothetical protein